eukprot:SAG31_NODE_636_length_13344_cov_8.492451_2_plen_86_part_00
MTCLGEKATIYMESGSASFSLKAPEEGVQAVEQVWPRLGPRHPSPVADFSYTSCNPSDRSTTNFSSISSFSGPFLLPLSSYFPLV